MSPFLPANTASAVIGTPMAIHTIAICFLVTAEPLGTDDLHAKWWWWPCWPAGKGGGQGASTSTTLLRRCVHAAPRLGNTHTHTHTHARAPQTTNTGTWCSVWARQAFFSWTTRCLSKGFPRIKDLTHDERQVESQIARPPRRPTDTFSSHGGMALPAGRDGGVQWQTERPADRY